MSRTVTFGIQFLPQYVSWHEMRDASIHADEAGWDVIMTHDHFSPRIGDPSGPNLEGWQILAAFGAVTKRAAIGMHVSANTYRHPAVLANMVSTLDHITHGRALLGIGAGNAEHEHKMYGIPFDTPGVRLAKLDEAMQVLRALLDKGTTTFAGKYYTLTEATLGTRPIQKRVPILVGGAGEQKTLRIVARYADWWHGFGTPDDLKHKLGILRRHCEEVGRDFDDIRATAGGGIFVYDRKSEVDARTRAMETRNKVDNIKPVMFENFGTPDEIAQMLAEHYSVGVRGFLFGMMPPYDHRTIDRMMTDVKPRFARLIG